MGVPTVLLVTTIHRSKYLQMSSKVVGPVAMVKVAISVESLMSAYRKVCGKCRGPNHFKAICHSKGTAKGVMSPFKKKPQCQRDR